MQRWARCRMIGSCEEVMTHAPEGDWVLHSDAAALIAAKDAEIEPPTREAAGGPATPAPQVHR